MITGGPSQGQSVSEPAVEFTFASDETGATFECSLDGGAFAPCPTPHRLAGLASGDHTLDVRAKDRAGNLEPVGGEALVADEPARPRR